MKVDKTVEATCVRMLREIGCHRADCFITAGRSHAYCHTHGVGTSHHIVGRGAQALGGAGEYEEWRAWRIRIGRRIHPFPGVGVTRRGWWIGVARSPGLAIAALDEATAQDASVRVDLTDSTKTKREWLDYPEEREWPD